MVKIELQELYWEPNNFSEKEIQSVVFEKGINFIIGEKSEDSDGEQEENKMNSVGKTLIIEAINFCLFKDRQHSRIPKIPDIDEEGKSLMKDEVYTCLRFIIKNENTEKEVIIKRRVRSEKIIMIVNDQEESFDSDDTAKSYLDYLIFGEELEKRPTLRRLLSILIREEKTMYDDILRPYKHSERETFVDLIKPHLYLLGLDLTLLEDIKIIIKDAKLVQKAITSLNKDIANLGIPKKDLKAHINNLEDQVEKLELALKNLRPSEGNTQLLNDKNELEEALAKIVKEIAAKEHSAHRIKSLPRLQRVNTLQVKKIFDKYQQGLGDVVKRSFDEVVKFKESVEGFQKKLMYQKLDELQDEIRELQTQKEIFDKKLEEIYLGLGAKEKIMDLAEFARIQKQKNDEFVFLKSKYDALLEKDSEKQKLATKKHEYLEKYDVELFKFKKVISEFEDDLKKMHKYIAGNKNCSFEVSVDFDSEEFIDINYRINLDGGASSDRIQTFIYDVLLMLNKHTRIRHLGFLIHDNIFASAGRDDMVKSLNYLEEQSRLGEDYQYIVTINTDEFESVASKFNFEYKNKIRAKLTRQSPYLGVKYRQLNESK